MASLVLRFLGHQDIHIHNKLQFLWGRFKNMQIPWNLPLDLPPYAKDRYSVVFPVITKCPSCRASVRLQRHVLYPRNVLFKAREYRIDYAVTFALLAAGPFPFCPGFSCPTSNTQRIPSCRACVDVSRTLKPCVPSTAANS